MLVPTEGLADGALSVDAIYRRHAADVARWAARLAGPRLGAEDLEDVVQEVFTLVHRHLDSYRAEAKLTTWLYRITENSVRQHRRRHRWRRFFAGNAGSGERGRGGSEAVEQAPSAEPSPEAQAESGQATRLLYRAMEGMNERYRTALVLFEIEDLPGEEVAELLGIKVANLWVLLHRARADLVRRVSALSPPEAFEAGDDREVG